MHMGLIAENIFEFLALRLGFVPTPLGETFIGLVLTRTILVGTKLGIFQALTPSPATAPEVAMRCSTHPRATEKLLNALVSTKLLRVRGNRYSLSQVGRKWLLKESPQSLYDSMLFGLVEAELLTGLEDFIHSGKAIDAHSKISQSKNSSELWSLYQRGMHSRARLFASEVARCTRVPKGARDMLDIGGSHGCYSMAICRRYPNLHAVILDLPEAVEHAAPILTEERKRIGNRVIYRAGNALTDDLGQDTYDLVFISQLVHHFDEASNRDLARRVARALRPGGVFAIQDLIRRQAPGQGDQIGALSDLYFALTSDGGTWSFEEMASWQRDAGLIPQKPLWLRTMPGVGQQAAIKPVK